MFKPNRVTVTQTAVTHTDGEHETGLSPRYWLILPRTGNSLPDDLLTYEMEITIFLVLSKDSFQE